MAIDREREEADQVGEGRQEEIQEDSTAQTG